MQTTTFYANAAGAVAEWVAAWMLAMWDKLRERRNLRTAMLVLVCMASTMVLAQVDAPFDPYAAMDTTPRPETRAETPAEPRLSSPPFVDVAQISSLISNEVEEALDRAAANGALQQMGNQILAFLLVLMLVWTALKTMISGRGFGELIGEWVPVFIAFGVAYLFLNDRVAQSIVSTMDAIGTAIGGQSMANLESSVAAVMEPLMRSFWYVWQMPRVGSEASLWDNLSPGAVMASLVSPVMTGLLKLVTAFLILIGGVVTLATVVMAHISLHLALLLAPVLVPFLLLRPLSWIFEGWLRFLLGACMLKIVVAFFLNIATALLGAMNAVGTMVFAEATSASPVDAYVADALMHGLMVALALLTTLLMMSAPGIATGLLSGSAGSIGFSGIGSITQSASGRIASAAVSRPLAAGGGRMAQGIKNWKAGGAGAKHALEGRPKDMKWRNPEGRNAYDRAYRNASLKQSPSNPQGTAAARP